MPVKEFKKYAPAELSFTHTVPDDLSSDDESFVDEGQSRLVDVVDVQELDTGEKKVGVSSLPFKPKVSGLYVIINSVGGSGNSSGSSNELLPVEKSAAFKKVTVSDKVSPSSSPLATDTENGNGSEKGYDGGSDTGSMKVSSKSVSVKSDDSAERKSVEEGGSTTSSVKASPSKEVMEGSGSGNGPTQDIHAAVDSAIGIATLAVQRLQLSDDVQVVESGLVHDGGSVQVGSSAGDISVGVVTGSSDSSNASMIVNSVLGLSSQDISEVSETSVLLVNQALFSSSDDGFSSPAAQESSDSAVESAATASVSRFYSAGIGESMLVADSAGGGLDSSVNDAGGDVLEVSAAGGDVLEVSAAGGDVPEVSAAEP